MDEKLRQLILDILIQRYVKRNVDPVLPTPATGRHRHGRIDAGHGGADGVGRFGRSRRQCGH